ncbi:hypothetical protein HYH02_004507 [Chlamydomonas schloesseri]|uniref:Uncharacterized protein n=1 Tax=Chlamydomonas schloesseri TaxID=2026947 RepID=A0A836B897_9CHLO|nr:hypothetical protein HYH02_004507 [Chlamydomonas schloesseri]|eukprot:KAG2450667.1 hypothetical protein HYH02_004507 [Chlamydomonas schloesseri]
MPGPNCPGADLSSAVKRCPFLHNVAQTHGESYAFSLAGKPACPHAPVLAEDDDFNATLSLFHGRGGVLPLPHLASEAQQHILYPPAPAPERPAPEPASKCPYAHEAVQTSPAPMPHPLAMAPLASMSMSWGSNWFNIHHLFKQHLQQHRPQHRKPPQQPQHHSGGPSAAGHSPGASVAGPGGTPLGAPGDGGTAGGKCPLRRALGPLAGIVFNKAGQLSCPEPIVKMRAALAATRPVRELRPQALPIKLMAVAMTTAALNVPCGMWREHTEKFSSQWFIAVHATIPFIAMLRKAVIMPKYAILFTIAAAIAGQAMGAKLERRRMTEAARDELAGLARAHAVAAAGPPLPRAQAPAPGGRAAPPAGAGAGAAALPVASMSMTSQSRQQQQQQQQQQGAAPAAGATASWGELYDEARAVQPAAMATAVVGLAAAPQFRLRAKGAGPRRVVRAGVVGAAAAGCKAAAGKRGAAAIVAMAPEVAASC